MFTKSGWQEIDKLIKEGYISKRKHPSANLWILNYTIKTQFEWVWNEYTCACRGLIVDFNKMIIARPFSKFFNDEQLEREGIKIPSLPFEVYSKEDGSLGIMYFLKNKPYIATRGSFDSEQAKEANKILKEKYSHIEKYWNRDYTFLFEIIYPENKIIVDYGDKRDLILLAVIDTRTGSELPLEHFSKIGVPIVKKYDGVKDWKKVKELFDGENKEGFVIKFSNNFRVKIKYDRYKELHKLICGLSVKKLWEMLKEGKSIDEIMSDIPDEFHKWTLDNLQKIKRQYNTIEIIYSEKLNNIIFDINNKIENPQRKDYALEILKYRYSDVMFQMFDKKDYSETIWKLIKPKGYTSYVNSEDV